MQNDSVVSILQVPTLARPATTAPASTPQVATPITSAYPTAVRIGAPVEELAGPLPLTRRHASLPTLATS